MIIVLAEISDGPTTVISRLSLILSNWSILHKSTGQESFEEIKCELVKLVIPYVNL